MVVQVCFPMHLYGKKHLKILILQNRGCLMAESLHILLGTSACLQWLCHSGERTVARGPLVIEMPQIKYFNVKQINNSENASCNVWLKPCPFNPTVLNFLHTSNKWASALYKSFIIPYFWNIFFIFPKRQRLTFHAKWFLTWDNLHEMSNYVLR